MEHIIRNIFFEKLNTKCGVETNLRPFLKKFKLSLSWDHSLKFQTVCFYYMPKSRTTKYIENKVLTICFQKNKKEIYHQTSCLILYMMFEKQ